MFIRVVVGALHLLALGIGFGAIWARGRAFRGDPSEPALRRLFLFDSLWGIAALLWISTGLVRAFTGLEKGTAYYLQNDAFLVKMGLLLVILLLEIWPMATLIRWRMRLASGAEIGAVADSGKMRKFAIISQVQMLLVTAMVFAAVAIARGVGS